MSDSAQNFIDWFSGTPLRILTILLIAVLAQSLGGRAIHRAMNRLATADLLLGHRNIVARQKERARTISGVLAATLISVVWVVATGMALG